MRCISIIITMLLLTQLLKAPNDNRLVIVQTKSIQPYEALFKAVCKVESDNDPLAVGDKHLKNYSYGICQIRQIRLDDYYNRTGIKYTTKDILDPVKSKEVFMYFMMQYNDVNYAIRKWNGSGAKTYTYLNKVKKHL